MIEETWYSCLALGFIISLLGVVYLLSFHKTKRNSAIATVLEFVAYCVMLYPIILADAADSRYKGVESVFMAILNTLARFRGDGYEHLAFSEQLPAEFFSIYNILMVIINLLMVGFAAGFVVQLFDYSYQSFRLRCHRRKHLILFSDCNAKTLSIAESIDEYAKSVKGFGDYIVVFSVLKPDERSRFAQSLEALDAIVVNKDIGTVFNEVNGRSSKVELFLFNVDEEMNLKQLNDICSGKGVNSETRVYAEVNKTHWSLYDNYIKTVTSKNDRLTINLVRTEETFIYDNLLKNSIFEHYDLKDIEINTLKYIKKEKGKNLFKSEIKKVNEKVIKILIAGVNDRNIEMLKAVLHLSQMPGYYPIIVVLDEEDRSGYLRDLMPELSSGCNKEGDALYEFTYKGNVSVDSDKFAAVIKDECLDFTFAFVNYGDDLKNINAALKINSIRYQQSKENGYKLQVCIADSNVYKQWNDVLLSDIEVVGQNSKVYSYRSITMSDIEELSKQIHEVRQDERLKRAQAKAESKGEKCTYEKEPWKNYYNNEYNRHSVFARTLCFKYKVKFITEQGLDPSVSSEFNPWLIYEHMRWDMYIRTLGYSCPEGELKKKLLSMTSEYEESSDKKRKAEIKKERSILRAKGCVHEDLMSFEYLHPNIQEYDGLRLSEEIVKAFN